MNRSHETLRARGKHREGMSAPVCPPPNNPCIRHSAQTLMMGVKKPGHQYIDLDRQEKEVDGESGKKTRRSLAKR